MTSKFSLVLQETWKKTVKSAPAVRKYWLMIQVGEDRVWRFVTSKDLFSVKQVEASFSELDDLDYMYLNGYAPPRIGGNQLNLQAKYPVFYTAEDAGEATFDEKRLKKNNTTIINLKGQLLNGDFAFKMISPKKCSIEKVSDIERTVAIPEFLRHNLPIESHSLSSNRVWWVLHKTVWNLLQVIRYDLRVFDGNLPCITWGMSFDPFMSTAWVPSLKNSVADISYLTASGEIPAGTRGWNNTDIPAKIGVVASGLGCLERTPQGFLLTSDRGAVEFKSKDKKRNRWVVRRVSPIKILNNA